MICAYFSKAFADSFIRAVQQGKPFAPPPDPVTGRCEWTANNMLSLAGLLFTAMSHKDPRHFRNADVLVEPVRVVRTEDRERVLALHCAELHSAIDFLSGVADAVFKSEYPRSWDAEMTGYIDEADNVIDVPVLRIFDGEKKIRRY